VKLLVLVLSLAAQSTTQPPPVPSAPAGESAGPFAQTQERAFTVQQDPALEALTSEVASELRCPVCQGLSIQDSPSELAQSMRAVVRDQLRAGKTPEEVKAYFVSSYGEWILLEPKAQGFNLTVYVLPGLAVLSGAAFLALLIRRWSRATVTTADQNLEEPELAAWD
jgi:cytochrome c-type biogenesis protein CcmH